MSGEPLDRQAFIEMVNAEGFEQIVTVEREPNGFLDVHTHPFEAKALILSGEIGLQIGSAEQVYRAGQVFHLGANEPHAERYGPEGVSYLVGRK
jgi:quercetin dioxygenase-like cupin family protein